MSQSGALPPQAGPPIDLRELFGVPWHGEGEVRLARWLRWFPAPRRFAFRSEIRDVVLGPLRVPVRYTDEVTLSADKQELFDELRLRILGLRIAEVSIRLRRDASSSAPPAL